MQKQSTQTQEIPVSALSEAISISIQRAAIKKDRKRVAVFINSALDMFIEHLALDLHVRKYELYALGARLLYDMVVHGDLQPDTRRALEYVRDVVARLYGGRPPYALLEVDDSEAGR